MSTTNGLAWSQPRLQEGQNLAVDVAGAACDPAAPRRLDNQDLFHHLVDTDEARAGRCGRQSRRC
jgi:hypothetical protein